jgi:FtsP/CotA-like multicopper oxidase with cupredoxin domain
MNKIFARISAVVRVTLAALVLSQAAPAQALVVGWTGEDPSANNGNARTFTLTAREDFISTSDGNSHYAWGYARGTDFVMQYPGPTLVVNQGDTVRIVLNNTLPVPVSIVFPGQSGVVASGGNAGLLTREAPPVAHGSYSVAGGPAYTFVANEPGTYQYHSGTNPDLQVEMGLVGALIVRPAGFIYGDGSEHGARKAYVQPGTGFDRETLLLLTEMDPAVHWAVYSQVQSGSPVGVDTTQIKPSMWFINGRNAPDTQLDDYVYWLPTQPYNALPRMHPGERLLMRVVNAGRDLHPLHHHGNHATAIAKDGRVLSSNAADLTQAPDLISPDFTVRSVPGQTVDLIYEWTGKGIGWDIYGTADINPHRCTPDADGFHNVATDENYREWCADHNKAIPVVIPGQLDIAFGEHSSGSPFLGLTGSLPQGHPGLNTTGGYYHMLHSHNEKEVTTDNIFPGGMMTMLIIEPWSVDLDATLGPVVNDTNGTGNGSGGTTVLDVQRAAGNNAGRLNADRTTLDYGTQGGNNTRTTTLTVMNTGLAPAVIGAPKVTNLTEAAFALGSGGTCANSQQPIFASCTITLTFKTNNNNPKTGTLGVPYNGGTLTLNLTGQ